MLVLRKGKKVHGEFKTVDALCESDALAALIPAGRIAEVCRFLDRNAFTLAIYGARARLGGGVMVEQIRG